MGENQKRPRNAAALGPNTIAAADGLAEVVIAQHAPSFLTRAGAVGRAVAEVGRGASVEAAVNAAATFGKGHMAELRSAVEFTVNAGCVGVAARVQPNALPNHPHDDLVISTLAGHKGVQVGVGSLGYLGKKALGSKADLLLVPEDAVNALGGLGPPVVGRIEVDGAQSKVLRAEVAIEDAKQNLRRALAGDVRVSEFAKLGVSAYAGAVAARDGFVASLLFDAVERFVTSRSFDAQVMLEDALLAGARSGVRTALQTYVSVDKFLSVAKEAFNAKIAQQVAKGLSWTGVVADVVVSTAADLWSWLKGEIEFEEVLRRAGVHVASAVGGLMGGAAMLYAFRGTHPVVAVLAMLLGGYLGSRLGKHVGQELFNPHWGARLPQPPIGATP